MPPNWKSAGSAPASSRRAPSLRVAVIGQSQFAADVVRALRQRGHCVAVVFTIPDRNGREDALARYARASDIPAHKVRRWREQGRALADVFALYASYGVELNVLPFCSQFIPKEVVDFPAHRTLCYHPSVLPRHRGASAINWTLIAGDARAGLSVFWADDGLDTGPILLQRECDVDEDDTVDTLYRRFLYPVGVECVAEAVDVVAEKGASAPRIAQDESRATYEAMLKAPLEVDFSQDALTVHNFVRGLDSVPGAVCYQDGENPVLLYQSTLREDLSPQSFENLSESEARPFAIAKCPAAWLTEEGLMIQCGDSGIVNIKRLKINGKVQLATGLFAATEEETVEFNAAECQSKEAMRTIWKDILSCDDVEDDSDFFQCGAASMDVVRLVETAKELFGIPLENEHVFLKSAFVDFFTTCVLLKRNSLADGVPRQVEYEGVELSANKMTIRCPTQLFIDGKFTNSASNQTTAVVSPRDETVLCRVQSASEADVDKAVKAASRAFETGEWTKISARERGRKLLALAELMEAHREELATLEALDSGAVYTLALKTHVGMSVETWRYYAGWCDKIHGETIPISSARPSRNVCFTLREPVGVCGLITPWNYPLMMLSWKMAACLAAGNTCVIKPANVCPLAALKFAELSARAGIPPGVINVLPGSGAIAGQALAQHPQVRKLGFTGSTEVGRVIVSACAGNLKKVSLELGGKSPLVVFADCDVAKAVRVAMQAAFFNKGENCIAAGRVFVEARLHDAFVERVVHETRKLVVGDPFDKRTTHGPQNHLAHLRKLEAYVRQGVEDGAVLACGGERLDRRGYYFAPTIFVDVRDHMRVAREESFGPIMCVSKFKNNDLDGVLKRANRTEFGLAAGVFTSDVAKAMKFAEGFKAGTVFVNTYNKTDVAAPFGGVKQSGFGKDLGARALEEYLVTKTVTLEY